MHPPSLTPADPAPLGDPAVPGEQARQAGALWLARALQDSRRDTLGTFAALSRALPGLQVPQRAELNPPLWELGHIGWFQDWWLGRLPAWRQGRRADPDQPRRPASRAGADALYDSSRVPHARRWQLALPGVEATHDDLAAQLHDTLALLAQVDDAAADRDDALYFFRLALLHEDMHHEAALYMARSLGLARPEARWCPQALPAPPPPLAFEVGPWRLGCDDGAGFAFDNERGAHTVALDGGCIDAQAVRWAEYLPFVEAGGYRQPRWWSDAGARWLQDSAAAAPRYLLREGGAWLQAQAGGWQPLDRAQAAVHLTQFEAEAWCRWAGRRLPTEAEWERAALVRPAQFRWGDVWEWTASPFAPFPGFVPHPYRDYSAPWFDGRPVLRGASCLTQPRLRHPRYRNFFAAFRNDVPAGFRSMAGP